MICIQPLLDSCYIEGKDCSRIYGRLATCISFRVLIGIVRSCEFIAMSDRFVVCGIFLSLGFEQSSAVPRILSYAH